MHQYENNRFIEEHKATIGGDFTEKDIQIGGKAIRLSFFDTAGQDHIAPLSNHAYRGFDACILVYDVSWADTFHRIDDWKNKFLKRSKCERTDDFPFWLLGNKIDLDDRRQITYDEGAQYAQENNMHFFETMSLRADTFELVIRSIAQADIPDLKTHEFQSKRELKLIDILSIKLKVKFFAFYDAI